MKSFLGASSLEASASSALCGHVQRDGRACAVRCVDRKRFVEREVPWKVVVLDRVSFIKSGP